MYDWIFGPALQAGRRQAMRQLPTRPGSDILEIGIGTGLTTSLYPAGCRVTGIDVSESMLDRAATRIAARRSPVRLSRMDASRLAFADRNFDIVYAAHVVSAVDDPAAVVREMWRVCRPDGFVVLLNHFRSTGAVAGLERLLARATRRAGFTTELNLPELLASAPLQVLSIRRVNLHTCSLVICRRR
jgi:phosphatidylethanolamine/phosphatidyl-N-methylethanolamine N-methyltransferase